MQKELEDHGMSHPGEWRKTYDEDFESAIHKNFDALYTYLEGEKRVSDKEKIKAFSETEDSIERLSLRSMSFTDAVKCLWGQVITCNKSLSSIGWIFIKSYFKAKQRVLFSIITTEANSLVRKFMTACCYS